jgi:hypothetical protein
MPQISPGVNQEWRMCNDGIGLSSKNGILYVDYMKQ